MRNFIFLFCSLFFLSSSMRAQSDASSSDGFFSNWLYGAKAGINLSNMYGDVGNNSYMFSFHFGAVGNKSLNEKIGLAVEPHISIEGQKLNGGFDRITFLNIPVMAVYKATDKISAEGGLKLGIKIIEKTKFGTTGETLRRNRFKTLAPGLVIGSTYKFSEQWLAQFRYNIKFKDVVRVDGGDSEGSIIMLFQFSAVYMFGQGEG